MAHRHYVLPVMLLFTGCVALQNLNAMIDGIDHALTPETAPMALFDGSPDAVGEHLADWCERTDNWTLEAHQAGRHVSCLRNASNSDYDPVSGIRYRDVWNLWVTFTFVDVEEGTCAIGAPEVQKMTYEDGIRTKITERRRGSDIDLEEELEALGGSVAEPDRFTCDVARRTIGGGLDR